MQQNTTLFTKKKKRKSVKGGNFSVHSVGVLCEVTGCFYARQTVWSLFSHNHLQRRSVAHPASFDQSFPIRHLKHSKCVWRTNSTTASRGAVQEENSTLESSSQTRAESASARAFIQPPHFFPNGSHHEWHGNILHRQPNKQFYWSFVLKPNFSTLQPHRHHHLHAYFPIDLRNPVHCGSCCQRAGYLRSGGMQEENGLGHLRAELGHSRHAVPACDALQHPPAGQGQAVGVRKLYV